MQKYLQRNAQANLRINSILVVILAAFGFLYLTACAGLDAPTNNSTSTSQSPSEAKPSLTNRSQVLTKNTPATASNPADLIFLDRFEYVVGRNDPNAANIFMQQNRWSGAKTMQSNRPRAHGYLYTVDSIPGYVGAFPNGSSRVLAMEALPATYGFQTDFYLQYGSPQSPAETIPGNVWFQFWLYINHFGNQPSRIDPGNKFLYACNGDYPCHTEKWLVGYGTSSQLPHWQSLGNPSNGDAFLRNTLNADTAEIVNTIDAPYNRQKLGQTNTSKYITANRWTLVKIHLDTSTQSGKYEAWIRPMGGSWVKVVEWIDGVTPGFKWRIHPEHVGGNRVLRMPTTIGSAIPARGLYDSWIYMDDFAMARSEAGLPEYRQ